MIESLKYWSGSKKVLLLKFYPLGGANKDCVFYFFTVRAKTFF